MALPMCLFFVFSSSGGGAATRYACPDHTAKARRPADAQACRHVFGLANTSFEAAVKALERPWWVRADLRRGSEEVTTALLRLRTLCKAGPFF